MGELCPISGFTINAKAARVTAFLTALTLLMFLLTPVKWIILILCADFLLRCIAGSKFSPFAFISRFILHTAKVEPRMENAGPKLFAAKIGLVFSVIISVLFLVNWMLPAVVFAILFLFCAALEALFGYCLGCKMYSFLYRPK
ncbi:MAG: DUF4395 domain-containing protein [Bacillota bacterium]